jgi:dienelactone hydrolase
MKIIFTAMIALLTLATAAAGGGNKSDVDVKAVDGINLRATYFSPGQPGPAVLLIHQCNMDRHSWDRLANDLAAAGFHVLTFDFRGFGDTGDKAPDAAARRTQMTEKWPKDVDAAYDYLISRPGVDKTRVAVGGASCGVTQAANAAMRHPAVSALVMLSGPAGDQGLAYISQTPSLAVFGAAADKDSIVATSQASVTEARDASKHPASTVKIYPGTEHGVPMFDKNTELEPMIVSWLQKQLLSATKKSN